MASLDLLASCFLLVDKWLSLEQSAEFTPRPLHEQIDPPIVDPPKPEPFVEPQRGIEAFDVEAQQPARRSAKSEGGACRRPPPLTAVRRAAC